MLPPPAGRRAAPLFQVPALHFLLVFALVARVDSGVRDWFADSVRRCVCLARSACVLLALRDFLCCLSFPCSALCCCFFFWPLHLGCVPRYLSCLCLRLQLFLFKKKITARVSFNDIFTVVSSLGKLVL